MTNKRRPTKKLPERPQEFSEEPVQPWWPTFIEKLLLSIIDANTSQSSVGVERADNPNREKRLRRALKELFDVPVSSGRRRNYQLHGLVASSVAQLQSEAANDFEAHVLNLGDSDRTRRISKRSQFKWAASMVVGVGTSAKRQKLKRNERAERAYLRQVAVVGSHIEEEEMARDLQAVRDILRRWNVELLIDFEALGMASLWGRNTRLLKPDRE